MIRIAFVIIIIYCVACTDPESKIQEGASPLLESVTNQDRTLVKTFVLKRQVFKKEIVSQGIIRAKYRSNVAFEISEQIENIFVETGQRVEKGTILGQLRNFQIQNEIRKINHQIEQANIQFEAKLISSGYVLNDSLKIPPSILKTALLESNLQGLEIDRDLLLYRLKNTTLRAPISGVVTEVEAQAGNPSSNYEKLCTIIDDRHLEAVFPILEQELPFIVKGQKVKIQPMFDLSKEYEAVLTTYKPEVDDHGMIQVFASISYSNNNLLDGMNLSVHVEEELEGQLVVPKSAVVDRENRLIVFVHEDGKANWRYVQTGLENSQYYTIIDGLEEGDEVIFSNNFHLSHLENVKVEN